MEEGRIARYGLHESLPLLLGGGCIIVNLGPGLVK